MDLQQNKIDCDPEELVAALKAIPKIAVLYLQGNPAVSKARKRPARRSAVRPALRTGHGISCRPGTRGRCLTTARR